MQSGTVADIAAVVDNCAVALQEAEEMAGFRPTQVVIGIAGELVKGFTTTLTQERKRPEAQINDAELVKLIDLVQREALREAERSITWETGLPHVDVTPRPQRDRRRVDRRLRADQPGRLPGPPHQDRDLQRVRAAGPPRAPSSRSRASWTSSCWRWSPSRTPSPASWARSTSARPGRCSWTWAAGRPTSRWSARAGIEGTRMFALGGRAFTKSIADRLDLPFPRAESLKVDYARGLPIAEHDAVAEIVGEDAAVWAAGVELVMEELAGGEMLPFRIHLCGGGSRLPEIREALASERFWKGLPFARPPEVSIMAPDQVEAISDATQLLVDQQDVTPLGLAWQAIEIQTSEDPLDAALRRVLRAMKV